MSSTLNNVPSLLFTSESVTEGHPDKMCDQISDAVLDACLAQDPRSRVACETATKTGYVMLLGEITTTADINYDKLARDVITGIGYDRAKKGFDGQTCGVLVAISQQSGDIALGVDKSLESKSGEITEAEIETIGAGDQGMMFGYACDENQILMPTPIYLAHKLSRRLAEVRKNGTLDWVRPDGKSQVTIEYQHGKPVRVDTALISTQHAPEISQEDIREAIIEHVIQPVLPEEMVDDNIKILVNPTGRFVIGGPMGDAGLTGRKIIVDTYGGMGRHGGGAFSGKDPSKVDRSAAYAMRHVAKNLVAAGIADEVLVQVAYAIGVAQPLGLFVNTYGKSKISINDGEIAARIMNVFDLRPAAIIQRLGLKNPIYLPTASYGHMGREHYTQKIELIKNSNCDREEKIEKEVDFFAWEKLDFVDDLKKEFGL